MKYTLEFDYKTTRQSIDFDDSSISQNNTVTLVEIAHENAKQWLTTNNNTGGYIENIKILNSACEVLVERKSFEKL